MEKKLGKILSLGSLGINCIPTNPSPADRSLHDVNRQSSNNIYNIYRKSIYIQN